MGKAMFEERTYEKKQEIEIRAARGGHVQSWVRARIDSLTSKGAHVTLLDSKRSTHVGWRDMRKIGDTTQNTPVTPEVAAPAKSTFSNPVLPKGVIDRIRQQTQAAQPEEPAPSPPMATVTPIRPVVEEPAEPIVQNQQRLVNVSKMRRSTTRPSNPLLAGLLKNAREMEELTQKDVADLIGSNQVMVSRFERGEFAPDDDLLFAYAEKLGMDLDLLLLARDQPEEAKNYKPKVETVQVPPTPPSFPAPVVTKMETVSMEVIKPKEEPRAALAMGDFFEFCDKMELICPQPTEPVLRKQWRELAQGLFNLRSKL
jgi:transcriptional regulator with XRE-family HTH domain